MPVITIGKLHVLADALRDYEIVKVNYENAEAWEREHIWTEDTLLERKNEVRKAAIDMNASVDFETGKITIM